MDQKLLQEIENTMKDKGVKPFIANKEIYGMNPVEKIILAIRNSDALFAILTKNALKNQCTRDWIFFEIGVAKGNWSNQEPVMCKQHKIFGWKDVTIELPDDSPVKMITDYRPLALRSRKSKNSMLEEMKFIAVDVSARSVKKQE
jgi:hypothetical protein